MRPAPVIPEPVGTGDWLRRNRSVALSLVAIGVFAFLVVGWIPRVWGFLQGLHVPDFLRGLLTGKENLAVPDWKPLLWSIGSIVLGAFVGSYVAQHASRRDVEYGLMPLATLLLLVTVFLPFPTLKLKAAETQTSALAASYAPCALLGFGLALFIVPLGISLLREVPLEWEREVRRMKLVAITIGGLLSALCLLLLHGRFMTPILATGTLLLTLLTFLILGAFTARMIAAWATRLFYRIRIHGHENLPTRGGALLVSNHASYADALLLTATSHRRIRFVMSGDVYRRWHWFSPVFRIFGVVLISDKDSPVRKAGFIRECQRALAEGYLVCIFAEGAITRTGALQPFRRGLEHIAIQGCPIIPVYIGGSYRTILAYFRGKLSAHWRPVGGGRHDVKILFGRPMPAESTAEAVRNAVVNLSVDYYDLLRPLHRSVGLAFVEETRRHPHSLAVLDTVGFSYTRMELLSEAIALGMKLRSRIGEGEAVGLLFPASCYGVLANVTAALQGWTAVNLNFTVSRASFASCLRQCNARTILTSREFRDRVLSRRDLPIPPDSLLCIEDLLESISPQARRRARKLARNGVAEDIAHARRTTPDSLFQILFSSGSTGDPKGIMLSHHNILSQADSLQVALMTLPDDRFCGILPFFHSFGLTVTVWFPLLHGMSVVYHPDPLDAVGVVRVIRDEKCTILMTTPSFLSRYLRRAERSDFESLRLVISGAEKLKTSLADSMEAQFGIRPMEGYGATEMSPVVSISHEHGTGGGTTHIGWVAGSIGQPLPGIAARIVDTATGRIMGPGESGILQVRGPNRMLGYLGRPDLTANVCHDGGWYDTGDIAHIDANGFIFLTDRQSRFSKIGGEMVPHGAVEEALLSGLGLHGPVLAVAGVPDEDERRGERLVVLFSAKDCPGGADALRAAMRDADLPNLWKPYPSSYFEVDAIPVLANGKMDLARLRAMARALAKG